MINLQTLSGVRADGEESTSRPLSGELPPKVAATLAPMLRDGRHALYAVIDGAAVPNLRLMIEEMGIEHRSLLQGTRDDELSEVAPLLIRLQPPDRLTRSFFCAQGTSAPLWNSNSAVMLVSDAGIDNLRAHLRRMTMVQTESASWLYFRFYSPSVLHGLCRLFAERPSIAQSFAGDAIRAILYQPPLRDHLAVIEFTDRQRGPALVATADFRRAAAAWVPAIQIERLARDIADVLRREDPALNTQFSALRPSRRFGISKELWRLQIREVRDAAAVVSIMLMTGADLLREPAFFYATRNSFLSGAAKARQLIVAYQMISRSKDV